MTARAVPDDPHGSWRDDAACLEYPAEWFTGPRQPSDTRRAIDICNTCPVNQPCLEAALQIEVSADLGIWGGTTPATRRRIRRDRHRAASREDTHTLARPQPSEKPTTSTCPLSLVEDANGDFIDRSGRVIVFEIHGDPPYMLMIDGRPRVRTNTVDDAAGLAARLLAETESAPDVRASHRKTSDVPRHHR